MYGSKSALPREVFETHKRIVELALEVNHILSRAQERMVQQGSTAVGAWLEAMRNEWQAVIDAEDVVDLLSLQVDVATDLTERVFTTLQELIDIRLQTENDVLKCLHDTFGGKQAPSSAWH
ncbi:MAG: phasin family protein [Gammaproteobacteria bacterium]